MLVRVDVEMNYYVLYCQTLKTEKICDRLNTKKNIKAFIPRMEKYIRKKDDIEVKNMFPGYLFIETCFNKQEFHNFLISLNEQRDGIIKELKKADVSTLTDEEIQLLNLLLDNNKIMRMSEGCKNNNKTIVTRGPLIHFQDNIVDIDKRDCIAILNITFLNRNIKAGFYYK